MGSCVSVSGSGDVSAKGRANHLVTVLKPVLPKRLSEAYAHTLYYDRRASSDCQPFCPQVDVWQYVYRNHVSPNPISTQKAFWKTSNEARVIAFSLFGKNPIYYAGLLDFLKSFQVLKRVNGVTDAVWGLETFTPRVYVPKGKKKPLEGELSSKQIQELLEAGVEIAYVDNGLQKVGKDATFWRFLVAAEKMPPGQRIRYLLRDADWVMTGAEAFSIGEWIASGHRYHRAHLVPICIGPLTASWWGGWHEGAGEFSDLHQAMTYFPYRFRYGDDELFLRDMVWPKMKASGSVLTHVSKRGWVSAMVSPYQGSCEEPTQDYCNAFNLKNNCQDIELPEGMVYPSIQLGLRTALQELERNADYFDMQLMSPRGKKVYEALRVRD